MPIFIKKNKSIKARQYARMFIKLQLKTPKYNVYLQAGEAKRGPTPDYLTRGSSGEIQYTSTHR
jgi:hypothetical protein